MLTRAQTHREYMAAYKKRRRALGLCCACPNPAPLRASCDACLERHRLRQREWRKRPDEKKKRCARQAVLSAVQSGRMLKPAACQGCGTEDRRIQAHHHDYARYLDVTWLCHGCHAKTHRKHQEAA